MRLTFACFILVAWSCSPRRDGSSTLSTRDVDRLNFDTFVGNFQGFGAQVWAMDNPYWQDVVKDLNLTWIRFGDEGEQKLRDIIPRIQQMGLKTVFHKWSVDQDLVKIINPDRGWKVLPSTSVEPFAQRWLEKLQQLKSMGYEPDFIETSNEPNGRWDTRVEPKDYARLVRSLSQKISDAGLKAKIIGPGTSFIDHADLSDSFVEALAEENHRSLGGWSVHTWVRDPQKNAGTGDRVFNKHVNDYFGQFNRVDSAKPIIVTEHGSKATRFDGVDYLKPDRLPNVSSLSPKIVTNQEAYGKRVFATTLMTIGAGADAVLFWEAHDQEWGKHHWGLRAHSEGNHSQRPHHKILRELTRRVKPDSMVWVEKNPEFAALKFKKGDSFLFALVNLGTEAREVVLEGVKDARAIAFGSQWRGVDLSQSGDRVQLALMPRSPTIVEGRYVGR